MEWITGNVFFIILLAVCIGMHLFGHSSMHGGHGGKEGDEHKGHSGEGSPEKKEGHGCH